ncbi:hypothetical protein GQ44DRAFT_769546 [Phaeosphaeriaceae sp. PMI808]|nr:hypothetical protein GQ44DRAFT_769546 [Phaeosphaeriaceae sp. PMI808]
MPLATVRLIPRPHGPNKYLDENRQAAKHADADPPAEEVATPHPAKPYVKLGRLTILAPCHKLRLSGLLLNAEKQGFNEELKNEKGEVVIPAEPHWIEEGIEHVGMWKRLEVKRGRLGSVSN